MRIFAFILRGIGQLALLAFLVISATFLMSSLIPGDFFTRQLLDPTIRLETVQQLRHHYGLDQPVHVQYARWLRNSLHLDFGYSLFYQRAVVPIVVDAISKTLWIALPALVLGLLGGIVLGTLHGIRSNRLEGHALDILSTLALSFPTLVLGLGALILASRTHWFPLGSMSSINALQLSVWQWLVDRIRHLALPVACLTVPILASVERIQSAATRTGAKELWVRAARARGLSSRTIFFRHLLRPSLNNVLAVSGPMLGSVLSGSLVLEVIFSWPGLGRIMYDAVFNNDLHLLVGSAAASTVLLVAGNAIADLLMLVLEPRTRTLSQGGLR